MPPRKEPRYKITWWMRFRSRLRWLESPLQIRGTIIRLGHHHKYPFLALLRLFVVHLRLPSWTWSYDFPLHEPLAPKDIINNEALFDQVHPDLFNLRYIPIWRMRDTPLRTIYRLYEIMMTREFVLLRLECEYMWHQASKKWSLASIPDPQDTNPVRYAMLASIVEELVKAFNWRLSNGQRRDKKHVVRTTANPHPPYVPEVAPAWTASVPPIRAEDLCDMPSELVVNGQLILEDAGTKNFLKRNFDLPTRYLYTT